MLLRPPPKSMERHEQHREGDGGDGRAEQEARLQRAVDTRGVARLEELGHAGWHKDLNVGRNKQQDEGDADGQGRI